jgi:hypothetical protein
MILRSERVEYPINLTQQQRLHDLGGQSVCVRWAKLKEETHLVIHTHTHFFSLDRLAEMTKQSVDELFWRNKNGVSSSSSSSKDPPRQNIIMCSK